MKVRSLIGLLLVLGCLVLVPSVGTASAQGILNGSWNGSWNGASNGMENGGGVSQGPTGQLSMSQGPTANQGGALTHASRNTVAIVYQPSL